MSLIKVMRRLKFIPPQRLLELYPPFFFMGVKVKHVSPDHRRLCIAVPLRWYGTNQYGSMFGGFVCAVSDPLPALLCSRLFPEHEIWTRKNCVEFLKPARGMIEAEITVSDDDVAKIEDGLSRHGRISHAFEFTFFDRHRVEIAHVKNTVFLRRGGTDFGV